MNDGSKAPGVGKPSRRTLIIAGAGVVAAGAGALGVVRGGFGAVDNAGLKPVSYSFEDSNLCLVTAAVEEGPFYVEEALLRSDIREDRAGAVTTLKLKIVDANGCVPLPGAAVDVWHCDAAGNYSAAGNDRTDAGHLKPATTARFLRGRQIADGDGFVTFTTIYPGWYPGRAPHIHLKVLVGAREAATTQLFFAKALSNEVYATVPYAARDLPETTNDNDGVLRASNGASGAWPKVSRAGDRLTGTLTIGVARAG